MALHFFVKNRRIIFYGLAMAALLFLLRWLELRLVIIDHAFDVYVACIAVIFTALGIWLALKLARPAAKTIVIEKEVYIKNDTFTLNEAALKQLNLSQRELDVLQLMARGLSNREIASQLFVSLNTVKTHTKNLFEKTGVERRTQAVDKARKLGIIP